MRETTAKTTAAILQMIAMTVFLQVVAWGQQPSPPPPGRGPVPPQLDRRAVADQIEKLRRRIEELRPTGPETKLLLSNARAHLDKAESQNRLGELFVADRVVAASDTFVHAAEHAQGMSGGPRGPGPFPRPPDIAEHLQHVYFHLQQADYFARTSGDEDAKPLPELARKLYEGALRAYDSSDWLEAENLTKAADDTIRGLENLAQAATPLPPRPR